VIGAAPRDAVVNPFAQIWLQAGCMGKAAPDFLNGGLP
jgi:hypothetical protein